MGRKEDSGKAVGRSLQSGGDSPYFPECVAKGSCFEWGSGGRTVFAARCLSRPRSRNVRVSDAPSIVICVERVGVGVVLCRCAVGVGGRRVVSDALWHCDLRGMCLCGVCLVLLCGGDWWGVCSVGRVWRRCAVEIGGGHVVWVMWGVALPWGLAGDMSCWACVVGLWRGDLWGARPIGCVWCRCAVGMLTCRITLARLLASLLRSCRVMSYHVL